MMRCCCTGVSSNDDDDPCPAVVVVVVALLCPADEDVVDDRTFPKLSSSPELLFTLLWWLWLWVGW